MPLLWANTQLWIRAGALLRVRRFAGGRLYGCEQTAQPDIHRAQIRDLIDFDLCVQLAFPLQNFSRFVGGDGVHAAAEAHPVSYTHLDVYKRQTQALKRQ